MTKTETRTMPKVGQGDTGCCVLSEKKSFRVELEDRKKDASSRKRSPLQVVNCSVRK